MSTMVKEALKEELVDARAKVDGMRDMLADVKRLLRWSTTFTAVAVFCTAMCWRFPPTQTWALWLVYATTGMNVWAIYTDVRNWLGYYRFCVFAEVAEDSLKAMEAYAAEKGVTHE